MPDGAKEEDANATMGEYSLYYTKWPRKTLTWSIVRYGKLGELSRSTVDNILAQVIMSSFGQLNFSPLTKARLCLICSGKNSANTTYL